MNTRSIAMNISSGNVIIRKSTANGSITCDCPDASNIGKKATADNKIKIAQNMAIRYLNFNGNSPIITNCWNDKRKKPLRQRGEI